MSNNRTSFSSDRLVFTEATWDEIELIHKIQSNPEVDRFNTLGIPENLERTREVMKSAIENYKEKRRSLYCWLIRTKEKQELIGICGLTLSAERFKLGEIYYNLLPEYWGKGYGTEIAKAQISFCFNTLKLHRVEAGVAVENTRSIHVLEKVGMTREGIGRKILPIRGKWVDNYEYSILEDDKRNY